MTTVFPILYIAALAIFTLMMAVTDTIWRKVPNKFTVPFAAMGLIFSIVLYVLAATGAVAAPAEIMDCSFKQLAKLGSCNYDVMFTYLVKVLPPWWAIAGFFLGFFILFFPALFGGVGFGDVKLLAALGIWLGMRWFLLVFVTAILLACVMSVTVLIFRGPVKMMRKIRNMKKFGAEPESNTQNVDKQRGKKRRHRDKPQELKRIIPFAIPVALATWLFLVLFVTNSFQNIPVFYK